MAGQHTLKVSSEVIAPGHIAQWLERLTADQQVPGSNPGVPSFHAGPDEYAVLCVMFMPLAAHAAGDLCRNGAEYETERSDTNHSTWHNKT